MPRTGAKTIECRHCGCRLSKVTDTRVFEVTYYGRKHIHIRRRRVCHNCKLPYTTIEAYEDEENPGSPEIPEFIRPKPKPSEIPKRAAASDSSPKKRRPRPPTNPYL